MSERVTAGFRIMDEETLFRRMFSLMACSYNCSRESETKKKAKKICLCAGKGKSFWKKMYVASNYLLFLKTIRILLTVT